VNPLFTASYPEAQYDSWLTVGMTNGDSPSAISFVGDAHFNIDAWSKHQALSTTQGAIFWMNPADGPSATDTNGKAGKGTPKGNIVIAQLTVKTGTVFDAQVNCQGLTSHGDNWASTKINFHFGSSGPAPPDTVGTICRDSTAFATYAHAGEHARRSTAGIYLDFGSM
jgi:hypothetical protein